MVSRRLPALVVGALLTEQDSDQSDRVADGRGYLGAAVTCQPDEP